MFKETKRGDEDEEKVTPNNKDMIEFMTEEDYYVTISLNSFEDKLIFNACKEEIGDTIYTKEFTLKDIHTKVSNYNKYEINQIFEMFNDSIYAGEVSAHIDKNDEKILKLTIQLLKYSEKKTEREDKTFSLDKIILSKNEIRDLLIDKVNFLMSCKNNFLKGCKLRKKIDENKEVKITSRINALEKNIDLLEKTSKSFIDSNLLSSSNIVNTLEDWKIITDRLKTIDQKYDNILFKLVYRATRDGDLSSDFHKKCDKIGENIVLVKTNNNHRFGGFTKNNWEHFEKDRIEKKPEIGSCKDDVDAFCFSIDLNKIYPNSELDKGVIFCCNSYGPTFCKNIFAINNKMLERGGYCMKKSCSSFSGQDIDYEISGGKKVFGIKELEVLEIIFV